ncbi:MAG: M23 family metallopeptidase [Lachnospiraceae bacterium]|nr:M23 family metallopeptidase [Lachnospiraceae bacterium]
MYISAHHRRLKLRRLKIAVYAAILSLFFMPKFVRFEHTGDNMFIVKVNGILAGVLDSEEEARECFLNARKAINAESTALTFLEAEMTLEGQEVLWGRVDSHEKVTEQIRQIMIGGKINTLGKAYEVKINDYITDLASLGEVNRLLQAAVDIYDDTGRYRVSFRQSEDRELPVMTPVLGLPEEVAQAAKASSAARPDAGFEADLSDVIENTEPAVERDFEDYELGLVAMEFGDEIEIAEVYVPTDDLADVNGAIRDLTEEEEKNEIYVVESGDTLSGISLKVNIPMEDLIAINDSLEDVNSMIHPNDELIITVAEPKLKVRHSEELYYEEDYDAPVEYIYNDDWFTTDILVHRQPSAGHRRVIAVVDFENAKKTDTQIIKEEVTYEPVAKIVEKGTKIPPTYIKPIYGGRLTSQFGPRKRPTRGASTYHKGVDWATPIGTTVMASSGGTVAKAGWGSGYGYVVYINHPDGRQTRYGHLSKVLVSAGQSVSQGQKIAVSGNTGVSTGPHLHFEILIGGSQVNPLKYMGQ